MPLTQPCRTGKAFLIAFTFIVCACFPGTHPGFAQVPASAKTAVARTVQPVEKSEAKMLTSHQGGCHKNSIKGANFPKYPRPWVYCTRI
jgi:hypothetical protein